MIFRRIFKMLNNKKRKLAPAPHAPKSVWKGARGLTVKHTYLNNVIARSKKVDDKSQYLENSGHYCLLFKERDWKLKNRALS
jgi:hypothetical protein